MPIRRRRVVFAAMAVLFVGSYYGSRWEDTWTVTHGVCTVLYAFAAGACLACAVHYWSLLWWMVARGAATGAVGLRLSLVIVAELPGQRPSPSWYWLLVVATNGLTLVAFPSLWARLRPAAGR